MSTPDILPDSRMRVPTGVIRGGPQGTVFRTNWVPVFCAICGCSCGYVMEGMVFAFVLCDEHDREFGPIAAAMWSPQQILWEEKRLIDEDRKAREIQKGNLLPGG